MLLFVYGSLRRNLQNNHLLESAIYIGEYKTIDKYIMIGTKSKSFPYIIKEHNLPELIPSYITGELYDVSEDIIIKLDILEDNPYTYTRQYIHISGLIEPVQAYILDNLTIIYTIKKNIGKRFVHVLYGDWKDK